MNDLPIFDTLETMAELGIAFMGFSGIVSVVGRRASLPWTAPDRIWFAGLLNWSFILILAGFLPSILRALDFDLQSIWYTSNLIFLAVHLASYLWFGYAFFFYVGPRGFRLVEQFIVYPSILAAAGIIASQFFVAFGVIQDAKSIYVIATAWFIYVCAVAFALMLFPRGIESDAS